jgi:hypothetical protein
VKKNFLKKLLKYNVWLPETEASLFNDPIITYMAMIKLASSTLFKKFIADWSNNEIDIVTVKTDTIVFSFKEMEFTATHTEFFQYLWGPYPLSEFEDIGLPLYIPGLDSI